MVSVLCIFAVATRTLALVEGLLRPVLRKELCVATRTLALVEGFGKNRNPLSPTVATRTLALVEGSVPT